MRPTPFALAFTDLAALRFPAIAEALAQEGTSATDRDRFVLLEPVGRLLRDIVPPDAGGDVLEGHTLLLQHAYLYWASTGHVYRIGERALRRAIAQSELSTTLPRPSIYLQLPELRVWGTLNKGTPAEPLDGMFVTEGIPPGQLSVLAIFGMRPDRPGFSAVGLDGRADEETPGRDEIEIHAAREDGGPAFGPILAGGTAAGLYSVVNAGELLLLTTRLLTLLPPGAGDGALEEVVAVD